MSTKSPCFHMHVIAGLLFIISLLVDLSHGDIGTASSYSPPYVPTACYGSDTSQFPTDNLFAEAGEEIWDNGAACGRLYLVRCISAQLAGGCVEGATIEIMIVDYAGTTTETMRLSETAYGMIASKGPGGGIIIIELEQSPNEYILKQVVSDAAFYAVIIIPCIGPSDLGSEVRVREGIGKLNC